MSDESTRWGYSLEESPERWQGACATREEAIAEGAVELAGPCGPPDRFWVQQGRQPGSEEFLPDADDVVEIMALRAHDETGDEDWPDWVPTEEAKGELAALLDAWATKHVPPILSWVGIGAPEVVVHSREPAT